MSVDAFTVDGKVTIDTTSFESGIGKVTSELEKLGGSMNELMQMGGGNWNFNGATNGLKMLQDDIVSIKESIASMNTEFSNSTAINSLKSQVASLREEMDMIKQKISEVGEVAQQTVTQVKQGIENSKTSTASWVEQIAKVTEGIVSLMDKEEMSNYVLEQQQSELGQINARWRQIQSTVKGYNNATNQGIALLERTAFALEKQGQVERQNLQIERERQRGIQQTLQNLTKTMDVLAKRNAEDEKDLAFLEEQLMLQKEINALIGQGGAENIKQAESLMKQLEADTEIATILREEIALEKEKLALIEDENALLNQQGAVRQKNATNVNKLDQMGNLPRRIGSMALTMWGFNEIMDVYGKTMGHIDAMAQRDYFAKRIGMDQKALVGFNSSLADMQKQYQKLDMTVVGANALETASKYNVQADSVDDLTEVMAIYGSEFVKQGRSQEDSILAVNDALDGELRRLKEVGIGAEELEATGLWSGDPNDKRGMILALKQIADERGYTKTAKDIVTLSDAITQLEVKLSIDLARAFKTVEPLLRDVFKNFIVLIEALEKAIGWVVPKITEFAKALGLIDKDGNATNFGKWLESSVSWLITYGIVVVGAYKVLKPLVSMLGKLKDVTGGINKGTGEVAKDTGGIAKSTENIGFKEGFKQEWSKLGKDLGKMARAFVDLAVAMTMAFALIELGILLIGGIGATYSALKPQFDSGIKFLQDFGIQFALLGAVVLGFSYILGRWGKGLGKVVNTGFKSLAKGIAMSMLIVTEAILMLIPPMVSIALLGGIASFLGTNLDKGLEVISWIGNALHKIDLPIALFIGGFLAISLLLGLVQPLAVGLAVGIATSLVLVTEAILMLIPPMGAIAFLGGTASAIGEENITKGAEQIKLIGKCLQILAEAIPYLLVVDLSIFGVQLVDLGNKLLSGGKDGLTVLVTEILPTIQSFITSFNQMDFSETLDTEKITTIVTVANQLPPLFTAIQKLNTTMGTTDVMGNTMGAIGGRVSGAMNMGLKGKLDQLYNDVKDVMDFATKLSTIGGGNGANASAVAQTSNTIIQLQAKLTLLATTITTASAKVKTASTNLGRAITNGFKQGSSGFATSVITVLTSGINAVQNRYSTWNSGGKTSAQKLADGFATVGDKLGNTIDTEMDYALGKLDDYEDDFYDEGAKLGDALSRGFKSHKGMNVGSPANIARAIAQELKYSMDALITGEQMMYRGGVALGSALTNGYKNNANLRTNVDVLARKGVSSEQLKANAKKIQLNTDKKGQVQQSLNPTINIDMSNSTVIGISDLDARIRQGVERAIIEMNSPNKARGY